jgi:hypothetical protein
MNVVSVYPGMVRSFDEISIPYFPHLHRITAPDRRAFVLW